MNSQLFPREPSVLRITVVNNLSEWREKSGPYHKLDFAWGVTLDDGHVVIKSPFFSDISPSTFAKVLCHEVNHAYWVDNFGLTGAGWGPHWIVEGLANLIAPARDLFSREEVISLAIERRATSAALEYGYEEIRGVDDLRYRYSLWRAAVAELAPGGNAERLMKCLCDFCSNPGEDNFRKAFCAQFGVPLEDFFEMLMHQSG